MSTENSDIGIRNLTDAINLKYQMDSDIKKQPTMFNNLYKHYGWANPLIYLNIRNWLVFRLKNKMAYQLATLNKIINENTNKPDTNWMHLYDKFMNLTEGQLAHVYLSSKYSYNLDLEPRLPDVKTAGSKEIKQRYLDIVNNANYTGEVEGILLKLPKALIIKEALLKPTTSDRLSNFVLRNVNFIDNWLGIRYVNDMAKLGQNNGLTNLFKPFFDFFVGKKATENKVKEPEIK